MDLAVLTVIVLLLKIHSVSAYYSAYASMCFGEYCFLTPGVNVTKTYDDANQWCIDNDSSNLMTDSNDTMHQIVTRFLDSSQMNSTVFIKLKLTPSDDDGAPYTWFLLNGNIYNGDVDSQLSRNTDYKYYVFLDPSNPQASNPNYKRNFICEYNETRCLNNGSDRYQTNGRCYIKYENETLTWFKARERCIYNGGDLVMLSYSENIQTNYRNSFGKIWLASNSYWIGVRWNNRLWQTDDNGAEAIYTNWSNGEPNNYMYRCVCLSQSGIPRWSWIDCDCNVPRPFVCLKFVPTTMLSTTTATTIMTAKPVSDSGSCSCQNSKDLLNGNQALIVGLVLGIGVIVPLLIVIIILIIVVINQKRKLRGQNYRVPAQGSAPVTAEYDKDISRARTSSMPGTYEGLSHSEHDDGPRLYAELQN